ncbi:MAG: SDR family NAD(P)-dependent oxidoreductase [Verrucomicrobia bacterium]|nr:SDR family NAD(P)-dependent oxidoreductase [Verrucomicrobiota bacterium]MCH8513983.1 SDR family NAD(P)-dependent oxidoreductase [Kiritimatiellia bacterium]
MNQNLPPSVLIFGITSAMAEHTARKFAADGCKIAIAGRNQARVHDIAEDLRVRGAAAIHELPAFDARKPDTLAPCVAAGFEALGQVDIVLIAHGSLPDQDRCAADIDTAISEMEINFLSVLRLCTDIANRLEALEKPATLGVISSVAGLRGRQSNYLYGSAKGGLNVFLQGLRNRMQPHGIRVVTLLPGFVDSPMTADIEKGPLFVSAEKAGACIHRALVRSAGDIAYIPFFWRWIMLVIRLIPEPLFKRLKL